MSDNIVPGTEIVKVLDPAFAEQLESIARKIEFLETTAIMQIAGEAAKIHEAFKYRRAEGGYAGYMKRRLGYSSSAAYRLLDVHTRFGGNPSQVWETLPVSAVYLLARSTTPEKAVTEVVERIEAGEKVTVAAVNEIIAQAKSKVAESTGKNGAGNAIEDNIGKEDVAEEDPSIAQHRAAMARLAAESESTEKPEPTVNPVIEPESTAVADSTVESSKRGDDQNTESDESYDGCGEALLESWAIAADAASANGADVHEAQVAIIRDEPVERLLKMMSEEQRDALLDRLISQQVAAASYAFVGTRNTDKLLTNLTGTLQWALRKAPVDGVQGLAIIAAKLKANKRDPQDIVFAWAKGRVKAAN